MGLRAPRKEQILTDGPGSIFQRTGPGAINNPGTVIASRASRPGPALGIAAGHGAAPAQRTPPAPNPRPGPINPERPGLFNQDFGAGADKQQKVGGSTGSAASSCESAAWKGLHRALAPNVQTRYF